MDRVGQLRKFIEASPREPFPRYALALELKGRGDQQGAAGHALSELTSALDALGSSA